MKFSTGLVAEKEASLNPSPTLHCAHSAPAASGSALPCSALAAPPKKALQVAEGEARLGPLGQRSWLSEEVGMSCPFYTL